MMKKYVAFVVPLYLFIFSLAGSPGFAAVVGTWNDAAFVRDTTAQNASTVRVPCQPDTLTGYCQPGATGSAVSGATGSTPVSSGFGPIQSPTSALPGTKTPSQSDAGLAGTTLTSQIQQQCQKQCQGLMLPHLQRQCLQQCLQQQKQLSPQLPGENGKFPYEPAITLDENRRMEQSPAELGWPPYELSAVERLMSGTERDPYERQKSIPFSADAIYQYGYSFFQGGTSFGPLTDVPVGPEYLIGAGDRIFLTAWGSLEGTYELDVNRNGDITLPKVGAVKVQGVSYGQLHQVLRSHLARVFKDFQLSATLGRTRLIKVYLVGEVVSPGDYSVSSLATVINALGAAGGPTRNGSLRNVQIKRGGKVAETVDLYDFFLRGDKSRDVRVQPGDTIFVPPIGAVAGIAGNVRRPAIYELKEEKTLKELLALANGINPSGYLQRVQITRTVPNDKTEALDFSIDPTLTGRSLDDLTGSIPVKDLDYVRVFPIDTSLRGYVSLDGYIRRPGDYALHSGMKVAELLKDDNLLPEYADTTAELVRLVPPDLHPEYLSFSPARARTGDPEHNLELREFDTIRVFSRWELEELPKVRVIGEVQKPGDYRLMRNMTVRDLLLLAGNPKQSAYLAKAELIRTRLDGATVKSFPITVNLGEALKGNSQDNLVLDPLDELIVQRIPNWLEETERYATIKGEVLFPGTYPIFKGERLSSLIEWAGGYTDRAYLFGAKFTRSSVQKLQQERMEEAIARMEKDIAVKEHQMAAAVAGKDEAEATKLALEGLSKSIDKLKQTKAEGRIALRLEQLEQLKKSPYNLELVGGDTLEIPQSTMAVTVLGEVANPTSIIWVPERDVSFYMTMAGGPTGNAETDEMYVVMANGMVRGKMSDGLFGGFMSTQLHPGDTVIVPQKIERISWMKEIKDITQILGNLAVAAGVPLAIIKK